MYCNATSYNYKPKFWSLQVALSVEKNLTLKAY